MISTTKMDYVGIKDMIKMSPALVGKHTFIYRIKSACGSVITQTEATLEVKTYKGIPATSINVCEATKTLTELETIIKNTNAGITTSIFGNNFEFQWYFFIYLKHLSNLPKLRLIICFINGDFSPQCWNHVPWHDEGT